jgi:fructosamine-3-kinase
MTEVILQSLEAAFGRAYSHLTIMALSLMKAVSLTILAKAVKCPKPLHIGKLPKVGDIGPGAFMILEWMDLQPFGAMRSDVQKALGDQLADMHLSSEYDSVHKGRFGFPVSNFLALTPLDNTWWVLDSPMNQVLPPD